MKVIKELVSIIDSYKAQHIEVLQNPFTTNNKYSNFYKGIRDGIIKTDEDASKMLYDSTAENHRYKKIKYRFRQRLLNSILFIDANKPNYTDIQTAYYNCHKDWAVVKILLGKGANKSAIAIAEKVLRHSMKYEFTELNCDISRMLRLYFATTAGDKKKFDKYNILYKEQSRILEMEAYAEELYGDLLIEFVSSRATKREYIEKATKYSDTLIPHLKEFSSYKFLFFSFSVIVGRYEIADDYRNIIKYAQKGYESLVEKKFQLKVQLFRFVFKMFSTHVKLGEYTTAKSLVKPCLDTLDVGSVNWFKFNQIHFIYLMHIGEYEEARLLVRKIRSHDRIKYQSADTLEVWTIYEAHAYFVSVSQDNGSELEKSAFWGFKLGKFLNEVPGFSKDKRGLNVSIIIIQILILLHQSKFNKIIDRVTGLERYSTRYLRKNDTFRSNCFIQMLLQLPRGNFNRVAVARYSEKYFKKLKEVPLNVSSQPLETEVIPYETLWEFVMAKLS